jgi:hypothetical protein
MLKHTRKMIMVPEIEYQTLINMLKGSDNLGYEKAKTDTKISQLLNNKKISSLIKGKTYDWLIKHKQGIKKEKDEQLQKPQKIILEKDQYQNILSDISKYLGVAPTTTKPPKQIQEPRRQRIKSVPLATQDFEHEQKQSTSSQHEYIIHPAYKSDFMKILKQNKNNLKIQKSGEVLDENDELIEESNYEDIVNYLTGGVDDKPPGTDELINRMQNKTFYQTALKWADHHKQRGEGKSFNITQKMYKTTKGLVRKNPVKKFSHFKPVIWAKIVI